MNDAPPGRHAYRRAEIAARAVNDLNTKGIGGLVMADLAASMGMTKANLTYYFRRKEDLASHLFAAALDAYGEMIAAAADAPSPRERIAALVNRFFEHSAAAARGETAPLAILSDIRSLDDPLGSEAIAHFGRLLWQAARLLAAEPDDPGAVEAMVPRAELLLVQLFWSAAWVGEHDPADLPAVARRLTDIVADGIDMRSGADDRAWQAAAYAIAAVADDDPRADLLRAATRLINQQGYRGTSLDRVAAAVGATKGAVYHHFDSKDDVVTACFDRSFASMRRIIDAADAVDGPRQRLFAAVGGLVAYQASERGPFLRATALSTLPAALRPDILSRWRRIVSHLAGLVTDGIAAGELRPVDAAIAAQALVAGINASDEVHRFLPPGRRYDLVELCARPLLRGLLA